MQVLAQFFSMSNNNVHVNDFFRNSVFNLMLNISSGGMVVERTQNFSSNPRYHNTFFVLGGFGLWAPSGMKCKDVNSCL